MGDLVKRSIAGGIYVALVVGIALNSFSLTAILMSLFLYICCAELGKILGMSNGQINVQQIIAVLSYYFLITPVFIDLGSFYFVPFAIVSGTIMALAAFKEWDQVFSIIYLTIPLALLSFIGIPDYQFIEGTWQKIGIGNTDLILMIFILMWSYDTFAYLCGRLFGKHPLAPKISPKKTWEGVFGGLSFAFLCAVLISRFLNIDMIVTIPSAFLIAIFGTVGDLFESYLKRQADLKDSGNILPGHGGLLDRLDGLFLAIPVVVAYIHILKNF